MVKDRGVTDDPTLADTGPAGDGAASPAWTATRSGAARRGRMGMSAAGRHCSPPTSRRSPAAVGTMVAPGHRKAIAASPPSITATRARRSAARPASCTPPAIAGSRPASDVPSTAGLHALAACLSCLRRSRTGSSEGTGAQCAAGSSDRGRGGAGGRDGAGGCCRRGRTGSPGSASWWPAREERRAVGGPALVVVVIGAGTKPGARRCRPWLRRGTGSLPGEPEAGGPAPGGGRGVGEEDVARRGLPGGHGPDPAASDAGAGRGQRSGRGGQDRGPGAPENWWPSGPGTCCGCGRRCGSTSQAALAAYAPLTLAQPMPWSCWPGPRTRHRRRS